MLEFDQKSTLFLPRLFETMVIRNARDDEVKDLQALSSEILIDNRQYYQDLDVKWALSVKGKKYFTKTLKNPKACCLVAEDNGKLIGYLTALPLRIEYHKSKCLEIESLGVTTRYRSRGIGSQLIQKCLELAKKMRFQKVYLNSYFKNKRAISFYKKNGFSEIDLSLEREV
jgi:ribosomal protein S18 acetylase RimI-like enzyme